MSDAEKPIRGFTEGTPAETRSHLNHQDLIADNLRVMLHAMQGFNEAYAIQATATKNLINGKKAILWGVTGEDVKVNFAIKACYVFPDPDRIELIPAIVFNGNLAELTLPISTWLPENRNAAVSAILSLPSLYEAATAFTRFRLIGEDEFLEILGQGNPRRQVITPIEDWVRL